MAIFFTPFFVKIIVSPRRLCHADESVDRHLHWAVHSSRPTFENYSKKYFYNTIFVTGFKWAKTNQSHDGKRTVTPNEFSCGNQRVGKKKKQVKVTYQKTHYNLPWFDDRFFFWSFFFFEKNIWKRGTLTSIYFYLYSNFNKRCSQLVPFCASTHCI